MASTPEDFNPAHRAERDISNATEHVSDVPDIVFVDEGLRKLQEKNIAKEKQEEVEANMITEVSAERSAAPVIQYESTRNRARLLFITTNRLVYDEKSEMRKSVLELERMFAEVHVMVLGTEKQRSKKAERISESVWMYPVHSKFWWKSAFDARRVANKALAFGNGFRPDIVIADGPFEDGLAGLLIAKKYQRPFQLHIKEDFFDATFPHRRNKNKWRIHIANYVLKRASCVRTHTAYLQKRIMERYGLSETQVEVLPVFYDLQTWIHAVPVMDIKKKYPEFKFTLLHISTMNKLSFTGAVIDGLFYILRQYPTIGLVVVGDGPDKEKLKEQVEAYSLSKQIKFEDDAVDVLSYIKTAQVLIHTSEETSQDQIILQAAISEVPIVCGNYGLASELFIDEESVLLCPVDSPPCFGEKINRLLNDNPLRTRLAMNARNEVLSRIEQDYGSYMNAYRSSIERCLVTEEK